MPKTKTPISLRYRSEMCSKRTKMSLDHQGQQRAVDQGDGQKRKKKIRLTQPKMCNAKRCDAYNFLFECDICMKSYCMEHMSNHKNCVLRLPKARCPLCESDIEIPRGQTSKDILNKHISETHTVISTPAAYSSRMDSDEMKEKKSQKVGGTVEPPHYVTNEWLIRLYHTSYAVFMEQHEGMGLSPLSRHCLIGIVRDFKFGNTQQQMTPLNSYDPHNMRSTWTPQALYKMIVSVACVMQMSTIEIVAWAIYLRRFGWFQPGLNPMQSLAITGFSVKLFLTVDYTMFLAYLNSKWGDFTNKFNAWVTTARLQRSSLTMVEVNMKYLDFCKSYEWAPPKAASGEEPLDY
jgi:hypothetical protein